MPRDGASACGERAQCSERSRRSVERFTRLLARCSRCIRCQRRWVQRYARLALARTENGFGVHLRLHTRLRAREAILPILQNAAKDGSLVVFKVVGPELREYLHAQSDASKVEAVDLIGKLAAFVERQPINTPTKQLALTEEYFRRIDAVEFSLKSDDASRSSRSWTTHAPFSIGTPDGRSST